MRKNGARVERGKMRMLGMAAGGAEWRMGEARAGDATRLAGGGMGPYVLANVRAHAVVTARHPPGGEPGDGRQATREGRVDSSVGAGVWGGMGSRSASFGMTVWRWRGYHSENPLDSLNG